ncbi:heavy-metal-associated domain-containing protein [Hymenobacter lapidiphilus]|uniref:heavy-metal-associated domain-containing protein n=1 Tax=Hymenobacter sp. CCM 8763 TaxID=2303334 RepID=UPI000E342944|nr:heavy metal-associated domain-containing protein [Hymenobacter sp. CCM 8763]RFP65847.1 heavy-metal-associated domain-containing protein [Hymenobacter sp. CCM 8763]
MKFFPSFLLSCLLLISSGAFAQTTKSKAKGPATATLQLKTSAVCDMCKARLEKAMAYEKGVQQATLDVPSQMLTVTFRPDKTNAAALTSAVQKTGYDANDQQADDKAYERLPECCKKTNDVH